MEEWKQIPKGVQPMFDQVSQTNLRRHSQRRPASNETPYGDHTAWLMAILSEIAYTPFREYTNAELVALSKELADANNHDVDEYDLSALERNLESGELVSSSLLQSLLKLGGFALVGELLSPETDTQGFVAVSVRANRPNMAVACFCGTASMHDLITAAEFDKVPVVSRSDNRVEVIGTAHRGFDRAYSSIATQLGECLAQTENLPIYLTGHSLGGALATLAALYLPIDGLAACYTFGSPRVGDSGLADRNRVPIYRIVNGVDPIPSLPPVGWTIIPRMILRLFSLSPGSGSLASWLRRRQNYRHYGFRRDLAIEDSWNEQSNSRLKGTFQYFRLPGIRDFAAPLFKNRRISAARSLRNHHISQYRAKLRDRVLGHPLPRIVRSHAPEECHLADFGVHLPS